jgi:hypothetical protein
VGLVAGENPVAEVGTSSALILFLDDSRIALLAGIGGLSPSRALADAFGSVAVKLALS